MFWYYVRDTERGWLPAMRWYAFISGDHELGGAWIIDRLRKTYFRKVHP